MNLFYPEYDSHLLYKDVRLRIRITDMKTRIQEESCQGPGMGLRKTNRDFCLKYRAIWTTSEVCVPVRLGTCSAEATVSYRDLASRPKSGLMFVFHCQTRY